MDSTSAYILVTRRGTAPYRIELKLNQLTTHCTAVIGGNNNSPNQFDDPLSQQAFPALHYRIPMSRKDCAHQRFIKEEQVTSVCFKKFLMTASSVTTSDLQALIVVNGYIPLTGKQQNSQRALQSTQHSTTSCVQPHALRVSHRLHERSWQLLAPSSFVMVPFFIWKEDTLSGSVSARSPFSRSMC